MSWSAISLLGCWRWRSRCRATTDLRVGRLKSWDADDLAVEVHEAPPLLPGLIAALVWMVSGRALPEGSVTCAEGAYDAFSDT